MLAYWGRDRVKGERLSVPYIVKSLARDPALAVGLADRGLIAPGLKADLNVVDFAALDLSPPTVEYTLPSGGKRLMQSAAGYRATIARCTPPSLIPAFPGNAEAEDLAKERTHSCYQATL